MVETRPSDRTLDLAFEQDISDRLYVALRQTMSSRTYSYLCRVVVAPGGENPLHRFHRSHSPALRKELRRNV